MSDEETIMIDAENIPAGTEVTFAHEPGVRWLVVGPSERGRFDVPSYVCRQLSGDPTLYGRDRDEDGTIDMDGEAIAAALEP